jgi:alpha-L-fucosidase 2
MNTKYLAMTIVSLLTLAPLASTADPTTQSFNSKTGVMDVDYAHYLSKHDIVFNKPITNPLYGATVGNGRVGAMVWNTNGLTMQVTGVDASEETAFSAGLINLSTTPGMDAGGGKFQQRLSLYDGALVTTYRADRKVTIMGAPNSEVMGIHVDDKRAGVTSINLDLSLWDVAKLGGGDVPNIDTWRTVTTYADASGIGLSRGQSDPNNFGYTLAATVEGAKFTTQTIGPNKVRLVITPSSSYTIWIACASRLNAPEHSSVPQAKRLLGAVKTKGYAATMASYENWWHAFWAKSFVQYSGMSGDADYLENAYYLYTYLIAAGGYANYPFHFINGAYSAVEDQHSNKWSVAYWFWNQRDVYNGFLAANRPEVLDGYNNLYSRNFDALKAYTQTKYGIDGIWVPETMGWDGNARHTDDSDFTKNIYSTGTEAAENMYDRYRYTNDAAYLRDKAYPFMREVAKFYTSKFTKNADTGKYEMLMSNAHETYWRVKDAITDLAAVRSLFPITIAASEKLGVDTDLRARWSDVLANLAPYPVAEDGQSYLPHDPPAIKMTNGENITSELLWPYSVTGIGASDFSKALINFNTRPNAYSNVWSPDAIQAARLGLGDAAYQGMKVMLEMYQTYPNGRTDNTNGEFEYMGVHILAMNESLLQSYNDKIRVFPASPNDKSFIGSFTLLAKGGFLVSSERTAGDVKYIGIKSLYGNLATVVNPWGSQPVIVRKASGDIVLKSSEPELHFNTATNAVYVIERVGRPLGEYKHLRLAGTANNDAKGLDTNASTLGSYAGARPDTGKYEGEEADLTACFASSDHGASHGREVTNMALGSAVTFHHVRAGGQLTIQYCTQNDPGKLTLSINGVRSQELTFPSTHSWTETYETLTVKVSIPQGADIKLQYDDGGSGVNIDYIQVENL